MVAVVAGKGLGLFNSSLNTLGGAGTMGQAGIGQAGGRAYVNAYSGNLVIQFSDEQLAGISQDLFALRTYNSQGALNGATDWRWDGERKIVLNYVAAEIEGDPPVLASITRTTGDGRETTYTLEGNRYISTDGDGAHDYLAQDENTGEWVWVDGSTRLSERYQLQAAAEGILPTNGRLVSQIDASGNRITFAYDAAGRLETVTDIGSGQALTYTYDAVTGRVIGLKTQFKTLGPDGKPVTITPLQVAYEYDDLGRLAKVRTEVTERTSASQASTYDTLDSNVSETVYTYDESSTRIASVTQGDGTKASFTYYGDGRIHTVTDAAGTTTYEYATAERTSDEAGLEHVTYITNGLGQEWTYVSGDNGRLIEILSPGNDGTSLVTRFKYDADGNVTSVTDGRGNVLTYEYDDNGNRTLERDATGAVVRRAYNASNQVTSETRYTAKATKDENGNWVDPTTGGQSTRYVYDSFQRLRFVVGGQGDVTEYRYNVAGLATHVIQYTGGVFTPTATSLLEGQLMAWVSAQDKTKTTLTENVYDYRGNLSKSTSFAQTDLNGKGVLTAAATVTEFVHDAHGQLLQTIAVRGADRSSRTTLRLTAPLTPLRSPRVRG
ncbi:MAG: hypothetical protein K0S42_32 [Microvirga sp.]|nr:hypothetical protein [Microvirga sp.]